MAGIQRVTRQLAKVLGILLEARLSSDDPQGQKLHGYALMDLSGLSGPSVYRNLDRLEDMALVEAWWEPVTDEQVRPRRRYYVLTDSGIASAHEALRRYPEVRDELRELRPDRLSPAPQPGLGTLIAVLVGLQ